MCIENVLRWYEYSNAFDRSAGAGWYPYARQECVSVAERYRADHKRTVWATAALSPQLKWERNIQAVCEVMKGNLHPAGAYAFNVEKALHILYDEGPWEHYLSGPKVTNFAKNIWGDPRAVTVDTWAWRIWSNADLRAQPKALDKVYATIVADYQAAADIIGIEPRQLQAITWVTIRRVANGKSAAGQLSLDI